MFIDSPPPPPGKGGDSSMKCPDVCVGGGEWMGGGGHVACRL